MGHATQKVNKGEERGRRRPVGKGLRDARRKVVVAPFLPRKVTVSRRDRGIRAGLGNPFFCDEVWKSSSFRRIKE